MEVPSTEYFSSPILHDLGKRLAAHVVGFSPEFIRREQVTAEVIEKHKKHHEQKQSGT
jgi:translation elongation factor EF-Ts